MSRFKSKISMSIKRNFFLFILFVFFNSGSKGQAIGDFISIASGNWTSSSTWGIVSGTGPITWTPSGGGPAAGNNVFVRSGHVVFIPVGGLYYCTNLTVEPTGQLYTANSIPGNNTYITVSGNILCNGQIGNAPTFDNICFNIEGANCTISGAGIFDACRLRKNTAAPVITTNLTISININLWFAASSTTQLYNNATNGIFNVTISAGATVSLLASGPSTGHVSIDGVSGADPFDKGGTFTINGTLIVSGIMYFSNNNSTNAAYKCNWIVNGLLQVAEISAGASANAVSGSSLVVNSGGELEITGINAWSALAATNNTFNFASGSTEEYSATGNQLVRVSSEFGLATALNNQYGHLILSNSGNKTTTLTNLYVKNDLTISGSAVFIPFATSINWVGGNWYNYNQAGFTEGATTIRFNNLASIGQSINCPGGEVFYNLSQVSPANILTFNCPVTAINNVSFGALNGHIDLNSNSLTINNTSNTGISGGGINRYIISEKTDNSSRVIWKIGSAVSLTAYIIPFGVLPASAANYIPVSIFKTSATALGDISIATYGTPADNQPWPTTPTAVANLQAYNGIYNTPDNRSWCVDRFWQVNATGIGAIDSLKFTYRTVELPTSDPTPGNMRAQFWAGAFGYWNLTQYGVAYVSASPVVNTVSVPNFNIYNTAWTLSSLTSPLPIELLYFDAEKKENSVLLSWSTATEINNQLFVLERSTNGKDFHSIGNVPGAGNSTQQLNYEFYDKAPIKGVSYYRIKQIDFDGEYSYSQTVAINFDGEQEQFVVFPNPATSLLYITKKDLSNSEINISDMTGRILQTEKIVGVEQNIYPIVIERLLPGVYTIELVRNSKRETMRFVKN